MTNEIKQEQGMNKSDMLELARKLNTTEGIEIFTPIRIEKRHSSKRFSDYEQVGYSIHSLRISKVDSGRILPRETERGYELYEHRQLDYANDQEGICFEVNPLVPNVGLRFRHFVFGISKDSLVEKLATELEKDRSDWMNRSREQGYCVLEEKAGGTQ
jgi:hypothetical protein